MWCEMPAILTEPKSLRLGIPEFPLLTNTLSASAIAELKKLWHHSVATDSHAIGWLPTRVFDVRHEAGDMTVLYKNTDCVGYVMASPSRSRAVMKLYQIWVRPDARIITHGKELVAHIVERCITHRCYQIEAWVAEDLPANLFWRAIGFTQNNWRHGRGKISRKHWRWTLPTPIKERRVIGGSLYHV